MSAYDIHLLIAYLLAVAVVWIVATQLDEWWKNRKRKRDT